MSSLFPGFESILILSIKKEHVDRIFSGEKKFELRKVLPKKEFSKIYFYQTEGGGVVGSSAVVRVIEGSPQKIWQAVGEMATTKERLLKYFNGRKLGYAIQLDNPQRFSAPIWPTALREYLQRFTVPQSYLLLEPDHPLAIGLASAEIDQQNRSLQLRPIVSNEIETFKSLIRTEIASRYAEIGEDFAENILNINNLGSDPNGFLTIGKEVLAIENKNNELVGFTVLTYKRGRSVKSGPTILLENYRNHGLGKVVRQIIEDRVINHGASKIYCTCPANTSPILSLLLSCNYRIEGHLKNQYSDTTDELVLGKELRETQIFHGLPKRILSNPGHVSNHEDSTGKDLSAEAAELLPYAGIQIPIKTISKILKNSLHKNRQPFTKSFQATYPLKPRQIIFVWSANKLIGISIISLKRGGSARAILAIKSTHTPTIDKLINAIIDACNAAYRKKIYIIHPVEDIIIAQRLRLTGFVIEGILRSPYFGGQDSAIYSHWL